MNPTSTPRRFFKGAWPQWIKGAWPQWIKGAWPQWIKGAWPQWIEGAWPLWILAAFFAVIFTANIALVYMANSSWTGLSTEDAYEKGRLYNQKIATGNRQRQLGWQGRAQLQGGRLELVLTTKTGTPLRGAKVEVTMRRPIHEGFDFSLTMAEAADGTYFTNLEVPLRGLWEADFNALSGADKFRLKQRFTVK